MYVWSVRGLQRKEWRREDEKRGRMSETQRDPPSASTPTKCPQQPAMGQVEVWRLGAQMDCDNSSWTQALELHLIPSTVQQSEGRLQIEQQGLQARMSVIMSTGLTFCTALSTPHYIFLIVIWMFWKILTYVRASYWMRRYHIIYKNCIKLLSFLLCTILYACLHNYVNAHTHICMSAHLARRMLHSL